MDIKKICRRHGKTMTEVATIMGTTRNNLSIIMRGNPTLSTLIRVAEALGIPTHQLIMELTE